MAVKFTLSFTESEKDLYAYLKSQRRPSNFLKKFIEECMENDPNYEGYSLDTDNIPKNTNKESNKQTNDKSGKETNQKSDEENVFAKALKETNPQAYAEALRATKGNNTKEESKTALETDLEAESVGSEVGTNATTEEVIYEPIVETIDSTGNSNTEANDKEEIIMTEEDMLLGAINF